MTNDVTIRDDGWDDAAAETNERILRGTLLKFSDWNWSRGKEAQPLQRGTRLVALATAAAWVRWKDGKPVEARVREPGKKLAERDELGDADEALWEKSPDGRARDPWQNTRLVYLVDPNTAEAFTFSTSSFGGREAVINLGDQVARMRMAHPNITPVVSLEAAPMITRFGKKSKPVFRIVDWKAAGSGVREEPKQLPAQAPEEEEHHPF